jgi:hypothetical protein
MADTVLPKRHLRWHERRLTRLVALVMVVMVVLVGASLTSALSAPGSDSLAARLAEWGRGHGLSAVIDALERTAYHPPKAGGRLAAGSPLSHTAGGGSGAVEAPGALPPSGLPPVSPVAVPPVPGEGSWRVLAAVRGRPALQVAYVRPDAVHTSYTAALAWMDTSLLHFVLHPGTQEPRPGPGPWPQPPRLTGQDRPAVLGAFNGGFRLDAARGGFLLGGRTAGVLRDGAASLVITADGRGQVGQWGRDVHPGRSVVAVRQNLDLLVDGGRVAPGLDSNSRHRWGATIGNRLYVWRSGVGQTATGALVYAAGDPLSAATLAELLRRAGSVRAMELDINAEWTSYVLYPTAAFPTQRNLLPDMQRSAKRYDTTGSRDFVAVLRRGR